MKGFGGFESWDETYVHRKHNETDRTVLECRDQGTQAEGQTSEPWTWVRTQGKGRVFYTAWGHDLRTWNNPGFQNLVERGIRWACGGDPALVPGVRRSRRQATTAAAGAAAAAHRPASQPAVVARRAVACAERLGVRAAEDGRRQRQDRRLRVRRRRPRSAASTARGRAVAAARPRRSRAAAAVEHYKMPRPLPPRSRSSTSSDPEGFALELFASEPDLGPEADLDELGRPRPAVGLRNDRLSQRVAAEAAKAATAFASAKTPTATAKPTSSPSSPRT